MTDHPKELDEIKAILQTVAERQIATQQQLERLASITESTVPEVTGMFCSVLSGLDGYTAQMKVIHIAALADRASERLMDVRTRSGFRSDMRGLQNESRNLLREMANLRRRELADGDHPSSRSRQL